MIQVSDYYVPLATPGRPCVRCGRDAKAQTRRGVVCWHCYLEARLKAIKDVRARAYTRGASYRKIDGRTEYSEAGDADTPRPLAQTG